MEAQFCRVGTIKRYESIAQNIRKKEQKKSRNLNLLLMKMSQITAALFVILFSLISNAQVNGWNPDLENDSREALYSILEKHPKLESFQQLSNGYVVFPKITKAAIGFGGAAGNGIVYKDQSVIGTAHLKQASYGIQLGGQQYVEVIFFENDKSFNKFINGKLKFDAQASAVVLKEGASIDAAYQDGVAVFTMTKGGLMLEASLGGQHFKYMEKDDNQ